MKVLVINGPNLNMLGIREPEKYGNITLDKINDQLKKMASQFNIEIFFFQSNHEGVIVDRIQKALEEKIDGILINAGAYTHTSIATRDAFLATKIPFVEVHLTNPKKREPFRHLSYLEDIALATISGKGENSYYEGFKILVDYLKARSLQK